MIANTDIDIDMADRDKALENIKNIPAIQNDGSKHKTSVYFQNIPQDPLTGFASFTSKKASEYGYFKIDLLNNSIYKEVKNEEHLVNLVNTDPPWELFEDECVVENLLHIHSYYNVVKIIKPKNIHDLAVIIALIRPGKKHLIGKPRDLIDKEIWQPVEGEGYSFKKSHSYAYAASIIVQLNLMLENIDVST